MLGYNNEWTVTMLEYNRMKADKSHALGMVEKSTQTYSSWLEQRAEGIAGRISGAVRSSRIMIWDDFLQIPKGLHRRFPQREPAFHTIHLTNQTLSQVQIPGREFGWFCLGELCAVLM